METTITPIESVNDIYMYSVGLPKNIMDNLKSGKLTLNQVIIPTTLSSSDIVCMCAGNRVLQDDGSINYTYMYIIATQVSNGKLTNPIGLSVNQTNEYENIALLNNYGEIEENPKFVSYAGTQENEILDNRLFVLTKNPHLQTIELLGSIENEEYDVPSMSTFGFCLPGDIKSIKISKLINLIDKTDIQNVSIARYAKGNMWDQIYWKEQGSTNTSVILHPDEEVDESVTSTLEKSGFYLETKVSYRKKIGTRVIQTKVSHYDEITDLDAIQYRDYAIINKSSHNIKVCLN